MTIPEIRDITLTTEGCTVCKAKPSSPCTCTPGLHLARVARAAHDHLISQEDFASVIHDADVFTGAQVVLTGAR